MAINYTMEEIVSLVEERVRENVNLDYKSVGALSNIQHNKDEISKDVSRAHVERPRDDAYYTAYSDRINSSGCNRIALTQ